MNRPAATVPRENEPNGRRIRSAVGAALPEARDARCVRLDIHGRIRRAYRMVGHFVHNSGHAVLVAGTRVPRVDMRRPARRMVPDNKVTTMQPNVVA